MARLLIPIIAFLLLAPSLPLEHQFEDAIEALNVCTAMEMRREGEYIFPTMLGSARLAKPPATAWITAAAIRQSTLDDLRSSDEAAYRRGLWNLAWDVRWPACLALCIMLVAIFELGLMIGGPWLGIWSAIVAASTWLMLKQMHAATIDAYFAAALAWANVFLMRAALYPDRWAGWIMSGLLIGIGFMFKGPMALLPTVLPVTCFVLLRRWLRPEDHPARCARMPIAIGALLMAAIGLWWYILVVLTREGVLDFWYAEVFNPFGRLQPGMRIRSFAWYHYVISMKRFLPWLPLVLIGLWIAVRNLRQRRDVLGAVPALMLVLPLVAMSFHQRRYDRYLLPMLGPGALLAAQVSAPAVWRWVQAHRGRWQLKAAVCAGGLGLMGSALGLYIMEHRDPRNHLEFIDIAHTIRRDYPDAEIWASYPPTRLMLFNEGSHLSIHLNRTIRWVADPMQLPTGRPQLLIRHYRPPAVLPDLPGWETLLQRPGEERNFIVLSVRRP